MSDREILLTIGTRKGLFVARSSGGRRNFEVEGPFLKGWEASALCRLPDQAWLLGTTSDVYGSTLYRSTDLRAWAPMEQGPRFPQDRGLTLNRIWTLAQDGERCYAGVDQAALFQSDDAGHSWELVEGLQAHPTRANWYPGKGGLCAHSLLVDPVDRDRLWCGISAVGVFRSEDRGRTWTPKNDGVPCVIEDETHKDIGYCVHALAADPDNADVIYRQDHRGMYRTANGGDTWERIEQGLPSQFGFPLGLDRRNCHLYCVPLESDEYRMPVDGRLQVYASRDRGDSWRPMDDAGLPAGSYEGVLRHALAVDHQDPCGIYVGTTGGHVYHRQDGVGTWQVLPKILPRVLFVQAFKQESA